MGWSAVGLDRGNDQVWSTDGRMLFCNGLGPRAASGTQRVLKNRAPPNPTISHSTPFANILHFLTPVPAAWYSCRVPVYRRLRFWFRPGLALASRGARDKPPRMGGVPPTPPHLRAGWGYE